MQHVATFSLRSPGNFACVARGVIIWLGESRVTRIVVARGGGTERVAKPVHPKRVCTCLLKFARARGGMAPDQATILLKTFALAQKLFSKLDQN